VKIDSYGPDLLNQTLDRVGRPTGDVPGASAGRMPARSAVSADEVRLSDDAQLMQVAMRVAQQNPGIRQDMVERMRALLEKGDIGNDPDRIADALLDRLITP
jgi:flagellar biosynthesis anti-sigma factor FlgM